MDLGLKKCAHTVVLPRHVAGLVMKWKPYSQRPDSRSCSGKLVMYFEHVEEDAHVKKHINIEYIYTHRMRK